MGTCTFRLQRFWELSPFQPTSNKQVAWQSFHQLWTVNNDTDSLLNSNTPENQYYLFTHHQNAIFSARLWRQTPNSTQKVVQFGEMQQKYGIIMQTHIIIFCTRFES